MLFWHRLIVCTSVFFTAYASLADNCDPEDFERTPPDCSRTWGGLYLGWTCSEEDHSEHFIAEYQDDDGNRVVETDGQDQGCARRPGETIRTRMEFWGFDDCDYCWNTCGDISLWYGTDTADVERTPVLHSIRDVGLEGDVPPYAGQARCGEYFQWPTQPKSGRRYNEVIITADMIVPQPKNFPYGMLIYGVVYGQMNHPDFDQFSPPGFESGIALTYTPLRGVAGVIQTSDAVLSCAGDLDWNGRLDANDLLTVLSQWGLVGRDTESNSGTFDFGDILFILTNWGDCDT